MKTDEAEISARTLYITPEDDRRRDELAAAAKRLYAAQWRAHVEREIRERVQDEIARRMVLALILSLLIDLGLSIHSATTPPKASAAAVWPAVGWPRPKWYPWWLTWPPGRIPPLSTPRVITGELGGGTRG